MPFGLSGTVIAFIVIALYLLSSIKILKEYERGVIFRLGRLLPEARGPGLVFVFGLIDRMVRVSLREETMDIPLQDVITRDNVSIKLNAVLHFRVIHVLDAVTNVPNYLYGTSQLAQTTLRSVLSEVKLDELRSRREKLNNRLQTILEEKTASWGIRLTKVEVKQAGLVGAEQTRPRI